MALDIQPILFSDVSQYRIEKTDQIKQGFT